MTQEVPGSRSQAPSHDLKLGFRLSASDSLFDLVAVVLIVLSLAAYSYNLSGWLMDDDEGSYLYQSWRISQGEVPYRDFLTPQLPLFLYGGAALFGVFGVSDVAARAATVAIVLLTAGLVYATARRAFGRPVALLGLATFLAHDTVFEVSRRFRPESFMLLFAMTAVWLIQRWLPADDGRRTTDHAGRRSSVAGRLGLALAGVCFGLALLSKLFAGLILAGCGLFGLWLLRTRQLTWRDGLLRAVWVGVPLVVITGSVFGYFYFQSSNLPTDVVGHHLRQGRELAPWQVVLDGLLFFWNYFWQYPLFLILAAIGAVRAWRSITPARAIYLAQLPTVLAFLFLSRQLYDRHMLYLLPILTPLFAYGVAGLVEAIKQQAAGSGQPVNFRFLPAASCLLLSAFVFVPLLGHDLETARLTDTGTPAFARLIAETTRPGDTVLTDYPGLNFYARRPSTYSGASLSMGAALSGQISGHDLVRQIQADDARLVTMQASGGQLVFLRDYLYFREWVQTHFHFDGTFARTGETHRIYRPGPPQLTPLSVDFGDQVWLSGYAIEETQIEPGRLLYVVLDWEAQRPLTRDYVAFVHLVDDAGQIWGNRDQELHDDGGQLASAWSSGAHTLNGYGVELITGAPPGRYEVRVGVYARGDQTARLPIAGTPGQRTEFTLAEIDVPKPSGPWWVYPMPPMQVAYGRDVEFGPAVRLIGYSLATGAVKPGDAVDVSLFWKTVRDVEGDFQVQLRLRDPKGALRGEALLPPSAASYPPTAWGGAAIVTGKYGLIVDPAAPAGPVDLLVNLVTPDGQSLRRDDWRIGQLTIAELPRRFDVPPVQHPQRAELGGYARLLGYDLTTTDGQSSFVLRPSSVLHLTLYWQGVKPTPISYRVFTHVIDADNRIYGQHDKTPLDGARPTTSWIEGEVLVDEYTIQLKPETPPGTYRLEVGLYDPATFARLPVSDAQGQSLGDRVLLDTPLEVVQ
jgi:hypothetical protein